MVDAVLSLHANPATCGVAKFSAQLAERLGIAFGPLSSIQRYRHPLVSLKFSEGIDVWPGQGISVFQHFDVFAHDTMPLASDDPRYAWVTFPARIYAASAVIAKEIRPHRHDVITAFCPATLRGDPTRASLNILTFGMAHKLQLPYYEKLKRLLDGSGEDYTLSLSTAVHEGSPWDDVSEASDRLRAMFGTRLRVLGYLGDDALAKELRGCSAVALFFDPALRANNTTFWAAMEAETVTITNLDDDSPELVAESRYGDRPQVQIWADINRMDAWPSAMLDTIRSGRCARAVPRGHAWDDLLSVLKTNLRDA